jgi:hypothetical protein
LCSAAPAVAESAVSVDSRVFIERGDEHGTTLAPSARFARGDQVVTVLTWQAPRRDRLTIVSAVPPGLELESVSRTEFEYSVDAGNTWRVLAIGDSLPRRVTHLRWRSGGDGRLSYRAVVR